MNRMQTAIRYAEKGQYVLPVDGKRPLIKFADQPALTIEQIKHYWSKWPGANIALRTVSFFVVDVDTKKAHGQDGLGHAANLQKLGVLPPTRQQRTASGGLQLFYKKPAGVELKQVIGIRPGIDIKAHPNNYVVVPPSTTNKGAYEWTNPVSMIEPPNKLIKLIQRHKPLTNSPTPPIQHKPGQKRFTGRVLDNLVKGAPQGQRNDFIARLCGQLIFAGADDKTLWELIQFANSHNQPPLDTRELEQIVKSILREELNKYE